MFLALLTVLLVSLSVIAFDCVIGIRGIKKSKLKNKLYRAMRQSIAMKRGIAC